MSTARPRFSYAKQLKKRLGLFHRAQTSPGTADTDCTSSQQSDSCNMLTIQLGRTSALRASASRTNVVALASLEPADTGIRKATRTPTPDQSWRLAQLRNLVPGWASTRSATQPGGQPTDATADKDTTSPHISPSDSDPSSQTSTTAVLTGNGANANDTSSSSSSDPGRDHIIWEQRSSAASTSARGSSRFHLNIPLRFHISHHQGHHRPKRHRHNHQDHHQHYHSTAATSLRHPTLCLIASRLRTKSKPGARCDGARFGLVVEGGGMRGCISGAMLMGLHDLGLTDVFDAVYGASAGAINATYYLTGQRHGLKIYHEDLTQGTSFLDFGNLFSGSNRPVMNIDFLIDQVMSNTKPLNWDAVLSSPTPLKVVASCLDSLQPVILSDFTDRYELAEALKATAAVPQVAGPPRRLRGRTLVDAAVFEPVPVPSAIRDGCTHLLVLCTRPAPTRRSPWARRVSNTIEVLAKTTVLNAPYMRDAWRIAGGAEPSSPAAKDEQLVAALGSCPHEFRQRMGAYVLPLYPDHTAGCHPLCLDPKKLVAACDVGHKALLRLLVPVVLAAAGDSGIALPSTAAAELLPELGISDGAGEVGLVAEDGDKVAGGGEEGELATAAAAAAAAGGGEVGGLSAAAVPLVAELGSPGPGREFGDAELYSADLDLRFRP